MKCSRSPWYSLMMIAALLACLLAFQPRALAAPIGGVASGVSCFQTFDRKPNDVTVDSAGNVYVVLDGYDATLIKLNPDGETIFAVNMPAIDAGGYYYRADEVALDDSGNIYVRTTYGNNVNSWCYLTKLGPDGAPVWTKFPSVGSSQNELTVDGDGNIYLIGNGFEFIKKYDTNLSPISGDYDGGPAVYGMTAVGNDIYHTKGNTIYKNKTPVVSPQYVWNGLAVDRYGYFYNHKWGTIINQVDPVTGHSVEYASGFLHVSGIATDSLGRVWVADSDAKAVYVVMPPPPDAEHSDVSVDRTSVTTDESATVSVTLKNYMGHVWSGKQVSLDTSVSEAVVTPVMGGLTDADGVARFIVSCPTVTDQVIFTAQDETDGVTVADTVSVQFTVGAASKLAWGQLPDTGTAGQPLSPGPVVYVQDAYGNLKTDDNSTVITLTGSVAGSVVYFGTSTVTGGAASFANVSTTKAGTLALTASADGGMTDAACETDVVPAALARLVWDTPWVSENGKAAIPGTQGQYLGTFPNLARLYLMDAFDNWRTGDSGTTIGLYASGNQLLAGNVEKSENGVVVFDHLIPANPGSFTLHAAAFGGITSDESVEVSIAPALVDPAVTKVEALRPGALVNFAGYTWVVVDPSTGFLLMRDPLSTWSGDAYPVLEKPFDQSLSPSFDPASPTSIAYYLNSTFYNSLPGDCKPFIQDHVWTTGPNDGAGHNAESASSVTCKIGLISYSEFEQYRDDIPLADHWWTRTPKSGYHTWFLWYDDLLADYGFADNVVRPALYLNPDYPVIGQVTGYEGLPGFPVPELMTYPAATEVNGSGQTTIGAAGGGSIAPNIAGDTLTVRVSATALPRPNYGDPEPTGAGVVNEYTSGSPLAASGWNFLGIYEIDSNETVTAFTQIRVPKGTDWVRMSRLITELTVGGYYQLSAIYEPSGDSVVNGAWSSSDSTVAKVNANGLVTALAEGTAEITVVAGDGLTASGTVVVGPAPAAPVTVNSNWPTVPLRNQAVEIEIPAGVTNAALSTLTTVSGAGRSAILPEVTSSAATAQGDVDIHIPSTTQVNGPAAWDGTIELPHVVNNPSIPGGQVDVAIEIGVGDTALTFSQPVRIVLAGQAHTQGGDQRFVGWTRNGVFRPIPFIGTDQSLDTPAAAIGQAGDGFLILGNDVVIWTKHFTTFVTYLPTSAEDDEETSPAADTGVSTVDPSLGGIVRLNAEASVSIPAGALRGTGGMTIGIVRSSDPPAPPVGCALVGAYELTVNGGGYAFASPVTLIFAFDQSSVPAGMVPAVYYYDSAKLLWVLVPGGSVSGNTITVSIDHFTAFAVMATPPAPAFSDVPSSHWGFAAISRLSSAGIVTGYPDGTFRPEATVTRAEFATMLAKALGLSASGAKSAFVDVAAEDWYYASVTAVADAGLVTGVGEGRFAPSAPITREQMAAMIARALGSKAPSVDGTELDVFTDHETVSSWALTSLKAAVRAGILGGVDRGTLAPAASASKAQAATMIVNLLRALGK